MTPKRFFIWSSTLVFLSSTLLGAGFSFFEQGAKATAMGGAFAATADDPSAMFYNVAGLAYQRDMSGLFGATFVTFSAEFTGDPQTEFPGGDSRAEFADHLFIVPHAYAVLPIGENATFAIGQFTPNALRTDWKDPNRYPGRFISQDANIKSLSIQPSFAMKTSDDRFAWGVGLEYRAVHISLERNQALFNPFTQRIADVAHVRLNSDWDGGLGWNAGLMFRPNERWSFGMQHRAAVEIDFGGDVKFTQISTGNAQLDAVIASQLPPNQDIATTIEFPSITSVGIATTIIPQWRVELDVVQHGWSVFDNLVVDFQQTPEQSLALEQNWDDALSYRIGGERPLTERWALRLGALYDETPQPVEGAGPLLPDADRYGVSFGLGYRRGPWTFEFSELAQFLDIELPDGKGFDLLSTMDEVDFEVIVTTSHSSYAIDAVRHSALDYLLKPVVLEELEVAMAKFIKKFQPVKHDKEDLPVGKHVFKKLPLPTTEGFVFVNIDEIILAEADRAYVVFSLKDGTRIMVSKPLGDFEERLVKHTFFRVHKSHIINLHEVKKYVRGEGGHVVMTNNAVVPVSRTRKDGFLKMIGH